MKLKKVLKGLFLLLVAFSFLHVFNVSALNPSIQIEYVGYCDLDGDEKFDDVYAEVYLRMWEGTNFLTLNALVMFHGDVLYSIYRDNHVRTEAEIVYKFYFINIAYESGMYIFAVWFEIVNGDQSEFLISIKPFDPPGGDPDYPPDGGLSPDP